LTVLELDPVDRITVGAVGEPGDRVFYLQARQDDRLVTLIVEKQQVQLLSATLVDILARLGKEIEDAGDEEMDLEEPLVPEFRAGRLAVGYQEDRDLMLLEAEELAPDDEDDEEEAQGEQIRMWATREQMLSLARTGAAVVAAGRPQCRYCGNPMDPEGHTCPAMNGHGEL
jgi:uncharacterized repeat protein (TIGR03847 family)